MADFMAELLDVMPHTLTAQPGFENAKGDFLASGDSIAIPCQIEGDTTLVPDQLGRDKSARFFAYTGEVHGLDVENWRYTLPAEFAEPREDLRAIMVDPHSDETGIVAEVVKLP